VVWCVVCGGVWCGVWCGVVGCCGVLCGGVWWSRVVGCDGCGGRVVGVVVGWGLQKYSCTFPPPTIIRSIL
jgi:hypothetical protein